MPTWADHPCYLPQAHIITDYKKNLHLHVSCGYSCQQANLCRRNEGAGSQHQLPWLDVAACGPDVLARATWSLQQGHQCDCDSVQRSSPARCR